MSIQAGRLVDLAEPTVEDIRTLLAADLPTEAPPHDPELGAATSSAAVPAARHLSCRNGRADVRPPPHTPAVGLAARAGGARTVAEV